jgi:hypothetical protein
LYVLFALLLKRLAWRRASERSKPALRQDRRVTNSRASGRAPSGAALALAGALGLRLEDAGWNFKITAAALPITLRGLKPK